MPQIESIRLRDFLHHTFKDICIQLGLNNPPKVATLPTGPWVDQALEIFVEVWLTDIPPCNEKIRRELQHIVDRERHLASLDFQRRHGEAVRGLPATPEALEALELYDLAKELDNDITDRLRKLGPAHVLVRLFVLDSMNPLNSGYEIGEDTLLIVAGWNMPGQSWDRMHIVFKTEIALGALTDDLLTTLQCQIEVRI